MEPLPADIVACPDCDLLQRVPPLADGAAARCPRCKRTLAHGGPGAPDRMLALSVAALVVFLLANAEPLMRLSTAGREVSTTVLGGAMEMWRQGERTASLLVALFAVVAPFIYISAILAVLLATRRPPAPRWVGVLLRWSEVSGLWSMVEVMLLGLLVALVKIARLASVAPGIGLFAVGALAFLLAAMSAGFDPREAWSRVRWAEEGRVARGAAL